MNFCTTCGAKLVAEERFCTKCGAEVNRPDSTTPHYQHDSVNPQYTFESYDISNKQENGYSHQYTDAQDATFVQQTSRNNVVRGKSIMLFIAIAVALTLLSGVLYYFFVLDGNELITGMKSIDKAHENGEVHENGETHEDGEAEIEDDTTLIDSLLPVPDQTDTYEAGSDVVYVVVPDLIGVKHTELESVFDELNLIPEYEFIEDDAEEGTVLWVADSGGEVPINTTLTVQVSLGLPYTYIENPRIVVTTRYDSTRGRFLDRNSYTNSVIAAGGIPILPGDDVMIASAIRDGNIANADAIAEKYDGLVLTGGGDISARLFGQERHPASGNPDENRDIAEIALAQAFVNAGKPVLGINRGMQVLNVAMGGDLIQDIPDLLGIGSNIHSGNNRHTIQIEPDTWLYDMYGSSLSTYSSHHQAIGRLADGFNTVASIGPVIEAIERGDILGVQFNPERLSDGGTLIYSDFIRRCSYVNFD